LVVAANAGSALTPFGNPQNLYLYWYYSLLPKTFLLAVLPLGLGFLLALTVAALALPVTPRRETPVPRLSGRIWPELLALLIVLLVVLKVLPLPASLAALALLLTLNRRAFRVDYGLLLTFAAFFLLVDNLEALLAPRLAHSHSVFALAVLVSQGLSNVPTAILLAPLTENWRALLWGVNVGGFGTPWASLANLIALRLFLQEAQASEKQAFVRRFVCTQAVALAFGTLLYALFSGA